MALKLSEGETNNYIKQKLSKSVKALQESGIEMNADHEALLNHFEEFTS